jgi:hypothetical protein
MLSKSNLGGDIREEAAIQRAAYRIVLNLRIFDHFGTDFCSCKVVLSNSIAEISGTLFCTMKLAQNL